MFLQNRQGEYLSSEGFLTSDIEKALLVEEEIISSVLVRLKVGNKYLGCISDNSFLTNKSDDASLFLYKNKSYMTIGGKYLSLQTTLCADETEFPNLLCNYLNTNDIYYYKFKRDGIVTWKMDIDSEEMEKSREIILNCEDSRIGNLFFLDTCFVKFLKEKTLKYMLDRVYKEYHLTTYSSNNLRKTAKDERFFHVDYPYHDLSSPYPEKILGIQVIYTLDDFTIENGATMYVPNSYKNRSFPSDVRKDMVEYCIVPKGHIIFFRGDLWHSQGINLTDDPRVAILANFSTLNIDAKDPIAEYVSNSQTDLKIVDGKVLI